MSTSLTIRIGTFLPSLIAAALTFGPPIYGAAEMAASVGVEALLQSLESPDCRVRKAALLEARRPLVPPEKPSGSLKGLRQAVDESQGDLHRRLALIARDAEAEANLWEKRWTDLSFVERLRGVRSREEQAQRIEDARRAYLAIIRDSKEPPTVRLIAAGEMLFAIDRFHQFSQEKASPFPPGALRTWTSDLLGLLKSSDPTVRLIGAIAAGARPGIPGRTVRKGAIIPELIAGLRQPELTFRLRSQTTLEALTGRDSCLDPTDTDPLRESEIKAWESWWNIEKKRLAPEKLPGS